MAYKYSFQTPDGQPIEFDSPTMLTREEARNQAYSIAQQRAAQQQELEATAEESRGVFGATRDVGLGLGAGILDLGENLIGGGLTLLGAEDLGEAARETFGGDAERLRELQTPQLEARQQLAQQRLAEVEGEGFLPEATAAVSEYLRNPSLLAQLSAETLPQLIPISRVGQLTRAGAQALVKDATEKTLQRAGLGGAASTAGALQGTSVGMETYDRVYEQALAEGASDTEAKQQALEAARSDAVKAGGTTIATTFAIPGAGAVERAVVGRTAVDVAERGLDAARRAGRGASTLRGAASGFGGEALQEGIEEGVGAYLSNLSAIEAGADIDPLAGVGTQAGIGSLVGGVFGGPAGAVEARRTARDRERLAQIEEAQRQEEQMREADRRARGEMEQQPLPGFEPGAQPEAEGPPAPEPAPQPEFELEPTADLETTERQGELDLQPATPIEPARTPTGQRGFDFRTERQQLAAVEQELEEFDQTYGTLSANEQRQVRRGLQQERDRLRNRLILEPRPAEEAAETFEAEQPDLLGFYQPTPQVEPAPSVEAQVEAPTVRPESETFGGPQQELELPAPVEPVTLTEERLAEFGLPALARRPDRVRANFKKIARRFEGLDITDPDQRRQAEEQLQDVENRYSGSWVGPFSERMRGELQATEQQVEAVQAERERIGLERAQRRDRQRQRVQPDITEAIESGIATEEAPRIEAEQERRRAELRQQLVDRQAERVREQARGRIPLTEEWKDVARTQLRQRQEEAQMRERGLDQMAEQEAADFELDMQYVDDRTPQLEPEQKVAASDFVQQYTEAQAINDSELTQAVEQEARAQLGSQQWGRLKSGLSSQRRAQQRSLEREARGETEPTQPDLLAQAEREPAPEPEPQPEPATEPQQAELFEAAETVTQAAETTTEAAQDVERAAEDVQQSVRETREQRPSRRAVRGEQEPAADERAAEPSVDVDREPEPEPAERTERREAGRVGRDSAPVGRDTARDEDVDVALDEELPAIAAPLQRAFNAPTEENTNALLDQANQDGVLSDEQLEDFKQKIQQGEQARAKAIMHVYNEVRDYEYFTANTSVALNMDRQVRPIRQAAGVTRAATEEEIDAEVDQEIGPVDDDTDVLFSRAPYQDKQLSTVRELKKELDPITKNVKDVFEVEIVQSVTDLPGELDVPNNVRGLYQNGKMYIIADATSVFDAQTVLAHELVGHGGMESLLGRSGFNNLINQINRIKDTNPRMQRIMENIRREYTNHQGEYQLNEQQEAREIIAHIAEGKTSYLSDSGVRRVWNNIVRRVRNALTKLGFINPSDNLIDQLVYEAALHAQEGKNALRSDRVFLRPPMMAAHTMQRAWDKGYRGFDLQEAGRHLQGVADGSIEVLDRTKEDPLSAPDDDAYLDLPAFSIGDPAPAIGDGFDAEVAEVAPPATAKQNRVRQVVEALRGPRRLFDSFRVHFVDAAATAEDKIMSQYNNALRNTDGQINPMVSYVQALRSEGLAHMVLRAGTLKWNERINLWTAEREEGNPSLNDAFHDVHKLGEKIGMDAARDRAHAAFMARRELAIDRANKEFQRQADQLRSRNKNKQAAAIEEKIIDLFPGQDAQFYNERMEANRKRMELFSTYPELESAFDKFTKFKNNLLDSMVESGALSKEKADDFKNNIDYVPFNRILETSEDAGEGGYEIHSTGLMQTGTFKQLQGSAKDINNVLDNMAKLSIWMTQAAVRNQAAKQMVRGMREAGQIEQEYSIPEEAPKSERKYLVSYREDGKLKYFKLKDHLDSFAWRGTESLNLPALRMLSGPADWLRKGVTLSPQFIISQLQQDTFRAYSFAGLKNGARGASRVVGNWWRIRQDLRRGEFGDENLNRYGIMGMYDYMPEQARQDVEEEFTGDQLGKFGKIIRFGERNAEASDLAQRKAVFDQTLADTNDPVLSFWRASEIINFNRRGVHPVASILRQIIPFQNAYMQGMNVLGKSLAGRGLSQEERTQAARIFYGSVLRLAMLSSLYGLMMADDEDYMNQPSYIRSRYFTIPLGDGVPGLKIAMPADLGFMAKALPETAVVNMMRNDIDSEKTARELRDAFTTAVMGPNITPQVVKPTLEVVTNYSFFTGGPIVGQGEGMRQVEDQYRESTSELAIMLGQTFGYSPLKVDHLLRGYFGMLGTSALTMTDIPLEVVNDRKPPRRELADYPIARALFTRTQGTGFKEDFYNLRDDVRAAVTSLNLRREQGDFEGARELMEDDRRLLQLRTQVNQVENTINKSNQRIEQIQNSNASPEVKRERIDRERDFQARLSAQIRRMRRFAYDG